MSCDHCFDQRIDMSCFCCKNSKIQANCCLLVHEITSSFRPLVLLPCKPWKLLGCGRSLDVSSWSQMLKLQVVLFPFSRAVLKSEVLVHPDCSNLSKTYKSPLSTNLASGALQALTDDQYTTNRKIKNSPLVLVLSFKVSTWCSRKTRNVS